MFDEIILIVASQNRLGGVRSRGEGCPAALRLPPISTPSPLLLLLLLLQVGYSTAGRGTVDAVADVIKMDNITFVSLFLSTVS